jgi:endoglucanase
VSYYRVYRSGSKVASPSGPPYDDQPLGANTPYSYTVSAVDPSNNESLVNPSASATTPPGADLVPPGVPQNLIATPISGTEIGLRWDGSTDTGGSGLAGYKVFRNGGATAIGSPIVAGYTDSSLNPATSYSYQVLAYDAATPTPNSSGLSAAASATTFDTVLPQAPGTPTFSSITASSATAAWSAASDNVGVTGYRYSLNGGASWTPVGNVLSTNLSGLSLATQYTMYVQASDTASNWGSSSSNAFITSSYFIDTMSLVSGTTGDGINSAQWDGYYQGAIGSLTPNTTANGKTVTAFYTYKQYGFDGVNWYVIQLGTTLTVTGFSGNPGSDWLQSAGLSSTPSMGCSSTTCTWTWPDYLPSMPSTLTLVHK